MDENLKIDGNTRWVLGAVTNDGNEYIRNVRVNPITGAVVVEANVTSTNTQIGSTIPGGTMGSVLFLGLGSTLAEDNANFFYDDAQNFLGLGLNTPDATLHVDGSVRFDLGGDATGDMYYRDASGDLIALPIGTNGQTLVVSGGLPVWSSGGGGTGYTTIEDNGTPLPQQTTLNFVNYFTVTDNPGNTSTDVDIDVVGLGGDNTFVTTIANNSDFIDALVANNYFTTELANNSNFINTLTSNSTFQGNIVTVINNSGSLAIDLSTQVTGILPVVNGGTGASSLTGVLHGNGTSAVTGIPLTTDGAILIGDGSGAPTTLAAFSSSTGNLKLANGGTGASLSDPGFNAAYVWDDTLNTTRLAQLSGLTYNSGTNTLTADNSSQVTTELFVFDDFIGGDGSVQSGSAGTPYRYVLGSNIGSLDWQGASSSASDSIVTRLDSESNHPGVISISAGNNEDVNVTLGISTGNGSPTGYPIDNIMRSGNAYTFIVRPATVGTTSRVGVQIGNYAFPSQTTGAIANNSIMIEFSQSTGNIVFLTRNTTTTQSTTIAAYSTSSWYNFKIVINGGAVELYNGQTNTLLASHSTSVPAAGVGTINMFSNENSAIRVDYFSMKLPNLSR